MRSHAEESVAREDHVVEDGDAEQDASLTGFVRQAYVVGRRRRVAGVEALVSEPEVGGTGHEGLIGDADVLGQPVGTPARELPLGQHAVA